MLFALVNSTDLYYFDFNVQIDKNQFRGNVMLKLSQYSISDLVKALVGASLSIAVLLYLTQLSHQLWIMAVRCKLCLAVCCGTVTFGTA
jgi:hypothetical protein